MSLSHDKYEILATMLLLDKPEKATRIAQEAGKDFPSVMMHIIGLNRMGYTASPEKGLYVITEKGKKTLGIPEINREKARVILAQLPPEKSFYFYTSIGKPLNLHADCLQDFRDKLLKVDAEAVNFHMNRGDFETWFAALGDAELSKKTALLREKKMTGEEQRKRLHEIVENRCIILARMV